jgi:hypothetical protein
VRGALATISKNEEFINMNDGDQRISVYPLDKPHI